ncbi:hypothetical protein J4E00_23840 [Siccationidurans soli]|uniref:Uncharacterized protein n=1 Tax=Hymenobacter negativus TaxID=2795026 RepID=A0ABS3QLI9_9BACT|nr:hypothetical protein [Hymenobacter negativus]
MPSRALNGPDALLAHAQLLTAAVGCGVRVDGLGRASAAGDSNSGR